VSAATAAVYVLLALGVAAELVCALGLLVMRDVYDRLHFLASASLGAVAIAAAILVREGPSMIGLKAILLSAFLVTTSPVLVHVTARSARISAHGDWGPQEGERMDLEGR
jgi:monovalent cation/proton antiporter MnhG/PhaG subunit